MRFKVSFSLVVLVIVGVLLVGCGSSDSSSSSGAETTASDGTTTTAQGNGGGETSGQQEAETDGEGETEADGEGDGEKEAESEGEEKPLTKTEFNTRVNEICIQVPPGYEEEVKKLEKEVGKKPSKAELNLKAAIPPLESALESMKFLTPPAGEEEALEETTSALEAAITGLEEEPTAELSGPKSPFAEFQAVTKKRGFETCSGL